MAIAEKKGIFSDKLEVPINWNKPEGLKIDKNKPLAYHKKGMAKTNNNKSTYEELEIFHKHGATFAEVFINFSFTISDKSHWTSVTYDNSLIMTREQIEAQIDFMRTSMMANGDFEASLQIGAVNFPSGQAFEDWIAEKQMQLSSLKQEEIVQ